MRLLITFAINYPLYSAIMLFSLLLASVAESLGLSAMLPLFVTMVGNGLGTESVPAEGASTNDAWLVHAVTKGLSLLGLDPTIGVLLGAIVVAVVIKSIFMLLANRQVGYTVAHVATDLRFAFLRSLLSTRWEYYLGQPVGGLANAFATEAMRASEAYFCGARMMAVIIQAAIYASVALLVSWKATLVSMVAGAFLLYGLSRLIRMARRAGSRQTSLLRSSLSRLTDSLQSIKPLKAMGREELADAVLETETLRLNKSLRKQVFSKEALRSIQEPMIVAFLGVGLGVALIYFSQPFASVMVLAFLLSRLLTQLGKVQEQYQKMVIFESAYWALQERIHEAEKEREPAFGDRVPSLRRSIRLDCVSFKYGDVWVLNNASLEIPAGFFTSISGASGAGKTTVADLMMGLLRPQQGQIWIDDLPLAKVDIRSWRRMIGYVPQETFLLHDTVMRNVTLGDTEVSETDVENALVAAGAWGFVTAMPQGIHSTVGERGGKLSGGQRQRIAIARALVHNPAMLILDEATSGLDPESEENICDTLRQLRGKLTIVAISHQTALVNAADRAYFVKEGTALLVENCPDESPSSGTNNGGARLTN